jgi:hypothetical protein
VSESLAPVLAAIKAVSDTVKECGEIPAGTLYAALMAHGCTLAQFDKIIDILVRVGQVSRPSPNTQFDVIKWVGA